MKKREKEIALIARFMNLPEETDSIETLRFQINKKHWYPVGVIQYDSSWDLLMPVWKKFRNLQGMEMPEYNRIILSVCTWVQMADIEGTFESLCNAIKWYNETQKYSGE